MISPPASTPEDWNMQASLTLRQIAWRFFSRLSRPALGHRPNPRTKEFEPTVGQEGKDVVWVPTSQALVNRMLDMAKLTANDYVIDLGSGDGRTVITAAKRGAKAFGVEYNPNMVALSKRNAAKEGVGDKRSSSRATSSRPTFRKRPSSRSSCCPRSQREAAPEDPRHEAGHARRVELVHHG